MHGLTLYAYTFRSRAERVLWVLEELELDYELIRIDPFTGNQPNPELLRLNPDGKVPILLHQGKVLTESLAIMEYLNALSKGGLVPAETPSHYQFRRKLHYGLTEIEPYLWLAEQSKGPLRQHYHWPDGVYEESIRRVIASCRPLGDYLCTSGFLLEEGFSIADIYYYHILTWARQHGVEPDTRVEAYLKGLEQRPAFPDAMYWSTK